MVSAENKNRWRASMGTFFNELKRRNVVRVAVAYIVIGWLTFQLGEIVLPTFGAPDWVFKTLIFLVLLGFPFVLLFAWAFEITPEGVKKTRDVSPATSVTGSTGRKLDFVIIAALVIALAYFIFADQQNESESPPDGETISEPVAATQETDAAAETEITTTAQKSNSIAVLPFADMSPDASHEWFGDGLAEEILNSLARMPDLLVSARTSSFAYKNSPLDIPTIAVALGVKNVLEGSVRRSDTRLRVTAQLIRAEDGFHLWSETYDSGVDDMIEIQENVAIAIAKAMETAMDPEALAAMVSSGTHSIPAYEAYLRGLAYGVDSVATGDTFEYVNARGAFEKAIELDPEFTSAYWQLALFWADLLGTANIGFGTIELPADDMRAEFDRVVGKAIEFERNPASEIKYRALQAATDSRLSQALRLSSDYLEKRPNDQDAQWLHLYLLTQLRRVDEIEPTILALEARDGYSSLVMTQMILASLNTYNYDLIRRLGNDANERFKDDVFIAYQVHRALLWTGDIDGASKILPVINISDLPKSTRLLSNLRQACAENRLDDAKVLIAQIDKDHSDDLFEVWIGHVMMGEREEATELFRPFDDARDFYTFKDFLGYPYFDPRPLPNLMAYMDAQGIEPDRAPGKMPYQCNR